MEHSLRLFFLSFNNKTSETSGSDVDGKRSSLLVFPANNPVNGLKIRKYISKKQTFD